MQRHLSLVAPEIRKYHVLNKNGQDDIDDNNDDDGDDDGDGDGDDVQ